MIPDVPLDKVFSAGNAAGTGARIALCNISSRAAIEKTVGEITKLKPQLSQNFRIILWQQMLFPIKRCVFRVEESGKSPGVSFNTGPSDNAQGQGGAEDGADKLCPFLLAQFMR